MVSLVARMYTHTHTHSHREQTAHTQRRGRDVHTLRDTTLSFWLEKGKAKKAERERENGTTSARERDERKVDERRGGGGSRRCLFAGASVVSENEVPGANR